MKDKCGVALEPGQVVDVMADGIMSAYVVEVRDGGITNANGQMEPALLVLNIAIPMRLNPGEAAPVYVVRASDKPKAKSAERIM